MTDWDAAAKDFSSRVLAPAAGEVDRTGVIPGSHFDELTSRGFYGVAFASADPMRALADVGELLVAGCVATAFVWAQHHGTLLRLAMSSNHSLKGAYLAGMQRGTVKAGVSGGGYAKPEKPLVTARRTDSGYSISGVAPFVSGWNGLIDVVGVTAYDVANKTSVTFLTAALDGPGIESHRLELTAAHGSNTVQLAFDDLKVDDEMVMHTARVSTSSPAELGVLDRAIVGLNGSLALGTARRCLDELAQLADGRNDVLDDRHASIKAHLHEAARDNTIDIFRARAAASQFAMDAATYYAVAAGSGAIVRGKTAERLLREASFGLVCTSSAEIKNEVHTDMRNRDPFAALTA